MGALYKAVDLPDTGSGDLWRLEYKVLGSLDTYAGLSLLFAPSQFQALEVVQAPEPAALATFTVQPWDALAADGLVTLTAQRPVQDETHTLAVVFEWLGAGAPGAQPYELFDGDFLVVGQGVTAPVPEPAPALLLTVGVAALAWRRARSGAVPIR